VTAGYSGTPLPRKLGIGPGSRVLLVGAPDGFDVLAGTPVPDPAPRVHRRPGRHPYDLVLAFCQDAATLRRRFAPLAVRITPAGALWVAWPKRASGVQTDLDENRVRDVGLGAGLVDVKVCAVDSTWSGLKFVRRLTDRPQHADAADRAR
jgi:hypothetical protein